MIIALTNSKGGVGKTTIALHLAVWLAEKGARVVLVDADTQAASSMWLGEASAKTPLLRLQTADDVLEQLPKLGTEMEYVVVDGPAGLSEVTRAILFASDLAVLPCGPSVLDLRAASDALRIVRQVQTIRKGPPRVVLVPNKLQVQYRLSQELVETVQGLDVPALPGLRLRQAFADAAGQGTVVWRLPTRSAQDASFEIQELLERLVNHDTDKTLDGRRAANG